MIFNDLDKATLGGNTSFDHHETVRRLMLGADTETVAITVA